jgi:hypothetical protein
MALASFRQGTTMETEGAVSCSLAALQATAEIEPSPTRFTGQPVRTFLVALKPALSKFIIYCPEPERIVIERVSGAAYRAGTRRT